MVVFKLEELANATNGKVLTKGTYKQITRIINQPNFPAPYCLYYMFEGFQNEDAIIARLKKQEVSGVIIKLGQPVTVEKWNEAGIGVVEVPNHSAYYHLAAYYRSKFNIPFVEVIGSSGKTTTKEMVSAVLNEKFSTLVSIQNYNAPKGVAFNIFRLKPEHEAAVLEAGMSNIGHIDLSSRMIKPTIGIVTSLQRAHISRLDSMENIIKAKSEIVSHIDEEGCLILNGENEHCLNFPVSSFKGDILRFGFSNHFDIWASDIKVEDDWTYFKVHAKHAEFNCKINTFGKYNVGNALAAILVGLRLGMSPEEISRGLANFKPPSSRLQVEKGPQGITIINDNFNANPDSTNLLLDNLPAFSKNRPLVLVMGDMENPQRGSSDYARMVHFEIGEKIGQMEFDRLIAIGKWAEEYVNGALKEGADPSKLVHFSSVSEAETNFKQLVIRDCVMVFKASPYVQVKDLIKLVKDLDCPSS